MIVSNSEQLGGLVEVVDDLAAATLKIDVLILAAGFETRAFEVLSNGSFHENAECILVRFINNVPNNHSIYKKYLSKAHETFGERKTQIVVIRDTDADAFIDELSRKMARLPRTVRSVAIDISGMPSYMICCVLKVAREHRPRESQLVLYTSAAEYTPTKKEYLELIEKHPEDIELVPRSMALEMAHNLDVEAFSGYRSSSKSCLAVLCGYEAHRTAGVIDANNPALLLLMYGVPGDHSHRWRLDLTKRLHSKFEKSRRAATEDVSTLDISGVLIRLEEYYNFIIDEYDFTVSPIGSKMQSVAAYLFWERYGEIHLTFPLPIGYNPDNSPTGVGAIHCQQLLPQRSLFRSIEE